MDPRASRIAALKNLLKERIVILDGAMGTMLQAQRLEEASFRGSQFASHPKDLRGNFDILNITQPRLVQDVQRAYLEAGADIIKTNTFNANAISAQDYGLEPHVYEINLAGAKIPTNEVVGCDRPWVLHPYHWIKNRCSIVIIQSNISVLSVCGRKR